MMLFEVGDEVRVRQPTNLFHSELGKVVSIDHVKLLYKVIFHRGNSDVYTCFDLILVKRQGETSMKFKVGDKVKVSDSWRGNSGKVGTISRTDWGTMYKYRVEFEDADPESFREEELELVKEEETSMKFKVGDKVKVKDSWFGHDGQVGVVLDTDNYEPYNYNIKFDTEGDNGRRDENFMGDSLELVTEEEEKVMKFKVGDKVKVSNSWGGNTGNVGEITERNGGYHYPYCVTFEVGNDESFREEELELVKEEEKVMNFKVGDKVKVKDSWFGFTGEVGLIVRIDGPAKYPYRVKFDVVDEEDEELFAEGSLELVKEKQSFTKSDLKTGMGVVLRDGTKGHVLLGTEAGDVIRFINGGSNQWASVDEYDENMIDCDTSAMDLIEVYSSRFAYACLTDRVFNQDCVFKREEPKSEPKPEPEPTKMTMKEINEHFGKAIEIIE